jgi:hypothetical protein
MKENEDKKKKAELEKGSYVPSKEELTFYTAPNGLTCTNDGMQRFAREMSEIVFVLFA